MSDLAKINTSHLSRLAYVYLRQSSAAQVEHNRESTARQYALVAKAAELGWPPQQVLVIDEDLGVSGSGIVERSGFARLIAEVALGHVGIVLGLEVSRLARNNADWYRLLDLCGLTDTLIGDADGIYHPALFNDRLVLGLKGTMSEAELQHLAGSLARRHPQQSRSRRTAAGSARRLRLGRGGRRGPLSPRCGGDLGNPHRLCALCRTRFGASGLALAAQRGPDLPDANPLWCRDPVDRPELHRDLSRVDQPGLRRRLCLRKIRRQITLDA